MKLGDMPELLFETRKIIAGYERDELARLQFCDKIKQAEDLIKSAMEDLPYTTKIIL